MFKFQQLRAISLPKKTLCLTFDDGPGETEGDGPGPKTIRLAEYLNEQNIFATFFVVGKFVEKYPAILPKLKKLGHLIGNHTYRHININKSDTGVVISEINRTDEVIREFIPDKSVFFRAPWGRWNPVIVEKLNQSLNKDLDHIGPIFWDICGDDWTYWNDNRSAEECANRYIQEILKVNRGIVLMHDSSADDGPLGEKFRSGNRTYETIKILVPKLRNMGYSFVRLDKIPDFSVMWTKMVGDFLNKILYSCRIHLKRKKALLESIF